jgi:3-mercaptopyruvate sulfurtransferase SseA
LLLVFVNVATRTMAGGLDAWGAARYPVQRLAPAIEPSPGGGARMPA